MCGGSAYINIFVTIPKRTEMAIAFIGLGTNLGDRHYNLERAVDLLPSEKVTIKLLSGIYETEPWGFDSGNSFLNMAARLETELLPEALMLHLLAIETIMGRVRKGNGYSSRIIDLDLLFYDDLVIETDILTLPHPLLHKRYFVLKPLSDIAPDLKHPVLGLTVEKLLRRVESW